MFILKSISIKAADGKENDPKTCEDGIFAGNFIAAVIDGVTPKSSRLWQGKTSGRYARDILLEFFRELSGSELPPLFSHLEYELQKGKTVEDLAQASPDPGRTAIQENLRIQMSFENKNVPFGYPVLNGQGIEPSMIKVYPVKPGDQILLSSDGYPVLRGTLEESEKELQYKLR